jgi:hypothetical protein
MVLRRTGERRRRVVMDEALQSPADSSAPSTSARPELGKSKRSRQYSRNADRRNLPRCADFIPVSRVSVLGGWCLILTCLLILNLAYGFVGSKTIERLPLTSEAFGFGPRSLATWLQVTSWSTAGLVSLVIFSIRQHRSNDFRGTYRLWRWLAVGCVLLSLGTLVDFPGMISEWSTVLTGKSLDRSGTLAASLQVFTVLVVGARLLFELRSSRGATALASAAVACGIAALLVQHAEVGSSLQSNREFVAGNLWLWTAALTLMCLVTYARFVILHASGAIYVPEKSATRKKKKRPAKGKAKSKAKPKKSSKPAAETDDDEESDEESSWSAEEEEDETEEESDEEEESQSKPSYSAPLAGKMKSSGRSASSDEDEDEDEDSEERSTTGLSRAERKRLKREQRQGRRAA